MSTPFEVEVYLLNNAMLLEVLGLFRRDDGSALTTAASFDVTLFDPRGENQIPGVVWPQSLGHSANGDWSVVIPGSADVGVGDKLLARLTFVGSVAGLDAEWDLPVEVKRRRKNS